MGTMETAQKILLYIWNLTLFVVVSVIFLPSFFIVTYVEKFWSKKLEELFNL